jgi:SSS family solute:Na+ symporter
MKLRSIDILIVLAYTTVILYIAGRSRRFAGKSLENYFLAGRNMPGWMTGVSYAASMVSADAAVGYGGLAVVTGLSVSWIYLSRFGFALFLGAMLFAVFWRRLNTFTTLEFYELRFEGLPGTLMRFWLAFRTSLVAMVAWTGISLLALVKISEPVLGWGKTETLALAIPLAVFYVWFSGYLGVVLSNLVQVSVLVVGSAVLAWRVLSAVGGPHQLAAKLDTFGPATLGIFPSGDSTVFPAIACIAWLIGTSIGYGGDAAPMSGAVEGQRILSSRTPKEACKMYVVSEVTLFSLVWLLSVPCLAAAIFWPQLRTGQWDRELAYGLLMTRYLTPGLLGLVYVAMLGGIISVVGDNLNFGSQVLLNDIYRRHLVKCASERHYLLAGRLAIFVVLGLSLLVVYRVRFVFDVAVFMVGLSAAEMSANWAQWWWWRFNGWARVAASFGGGACYLTIALLWPTWAWWNRMFLSIGISTLLWIVVTLVTTPERHELLLTFYRRAHPLGRWAPIAQLAGEPRSTTKPRFPIAAGLALAFAGALAVMAYITGISQFYVGRYNTGLLLFSILVLAGALFFLGFPRYIDALLSPEEKQQAAESGTSAGAFGLHRVFSVVCFGASAVLGFQTAFLRGGPTSLTLCLVAVCGGLLLLHYGRTKGIKQSGV